ncbi:metallophosphoesterase [Oenococcus oeni]|uniref:metallophosphoesterase n=1 Tax=Oenococcus oeni TaxID=1247 RepID=UPI003EE78144
MKFVTSDTHFFDAGLMNHPNFAPARQNFFQVEDMNQAIIDAWNKVVSPIDTVYHCGDIGIFYKYGSKEEMLKILKQLHGNIIFVKGNHDSQDFFKYLAANNYRIENQQLKFSFHYVGAYFKYDHRQYFLTHYPLIFGITPNSINLHGHIHHNSVDIKENINVGIDSADFDYFPTDRQPDFGAPLSMKQIEYLVNAKKNDFAKRA